MHVKNFEKFWELWEIYCFNFKISIPKSPKGLNISPAIHSFVVFIK